MKTVKNCHLLNEKIKKLFLTDGGSVIKRRRDFEA